MLTALRKTATCLLIAATVLTPTLSEAAQGYQYFRMYGGGGNQGGGAVTPPAGTLSYQVSGPATATVGHAYAATSNVAGAQGAVSFFLQSGALAPGLSLNGSTGAVSGTPSAVGSYGAVLGVRDATNAAGYASFNVVVAAAMAVSGSPSPAATVGTGYAAQFAVTGGSAPYSFTTTSSLPPSVTLSASGLLAGTPSLAGDYANIVIHAADNAGRQADSAAFVIRVAAPVAVSWTPAAGQVGVAYVATMPTASGGRSPYHYTLNGAAPSGLTFDNATGGFSGTPAIEGSYSLGLTVVDADGRFAATGARTLTIAPGQIVNNPGPLALAANPPAAAQVGIGYLAHFTASGGSQTGYAFDLSAGTLPDGLTLDPSTGTISGAPTAVGTSAGLVVRVTDSAAASTSYGPFSITVSPQPALTIAGSPSSSAQVGVTYSADFTAFDGTGAGYSFTSVGSALPPGLALANVGGTGASLVGTPSHVGTYTGLKIRVTDSGGHTADSSAFTVTVAAPAGPALAIAGAPQSYGDVGVSYAAQLSASGGSGSGFAFSIISGSLPTGLSLDPSGAISGRPTTPQTASFTIQATDSVGDLAQASYSIAVAAPLAFSGTPTSTSYGSSYGFALTSLTSGGQAPYSYATTGGSLPSGMSLAADGSVTATDVTGATSSVSLRVTDAVGRIADASLTFTVAASVATAALTSPAHVRSGNTFGGTLSTDVQGAAWSFASIPAGLSAAATSNSAFAGTAPTVGSPVTYSLTATASNANVSTASTPFDLQVLPPFTVSGGPVMAVYDIAVGQPFATPQPAVTGAVGAVLFSLFARWQDAANGGYPYEVVDISALCPGLSFSSSTGVVSGTPTAPCAVGNMRLSASDSFDGAGDYLGSGSTAFSIQVDSDAATVALSTAAQLRSGAAVAGTLSTNIVGATWSFSQAPSSPSLALTASGNSFSGTAPTVAARTDFTATATAASGAASASAAISVSVAPPLVISGPGPVAGTVGAALSASVSASGIAGGANYALLKGGASYAALGADCPGLAFEPSSGAISGTPSGACSQPNLAVAVSDTFDGASATTSTFALTVSGATASIAMTTPANGGVVHQGFPIAGNLTTSLPNPTWSFTTSPTLTLTASGNTSSATLSGTGPAQSSQTLYTVSATATSGAYSATTSNVTFYVVKPFAVSGGPSGTVASDVGKAITNTPALAYGNTNISATPTLALLQGGSTVSIGTLCPGLSMAPNNGVISGTPTATCSAAGLTIQATDSDGSDGSTAAFAIAISAAPTISGTASAGQVGTAYAFTPTVSNGTAPYSYASTTTSGTLAAGLSFSTTTGAITGTPSASGTWTGTVKVTDGVGLTSTSGTLTVKIDPTLTISGTPAAGHVGTAYSFTPTVAGGSGTYASYSSITTSGALPAGLSFGTSTGAITGTPSAGGSWTGTITVTDSDGNAKTSGSLTVAVVAPLSISGTPTSGTAGTAYSWSPTISGGTAPYHVSAVTTSGPTLAQLPLSINSATAVVSGTPSAGGTWAGVITVTDSAPSPATVNLTTTLTIANPSAPVVTGTMPSSWTTNTSFAPVTFTGSGGTLKYTWSLTGSVPTGLSINASSGIVSGTPSAAGTYNFNVVATDAAARQGFKAVSLSVSSTAFAVTGSFAGLVGAWIPGLARSATSTATNPTGTVTWTSTGFTGSGISIDSSTGALSGTVSSNYGTYTPTVTATDQGGHSGSYSLTFYVVNPPNSSSASRTLLVDGATIGSATVEYGTTHNGSIASAGETVELAYPSATVALTAGYLNWTAHTGSATGTLSLSYSSDGVNYTTCPNQGSFSGSSINSYPSCNSAFLASRLRITVTSISGTISGLTMSHNGGVMQ